MYNKNQAFKINMGVMIHRNLETEEHTSLLFLLTKEFFCFVLQLSLKEDKYTMDLSNLSQQLGNNFWSKIIDTYIMHNLYLTMLAINTISLIRCRLP